MHFVESRGSGIDKVIIELENELLPAPDIVAKENYTFVTLHERKVLSKMTDKEKLLQYTTMQYVCLLRILI
ncbi:hypothetical protein ACGO3R_12650 [Lactococcus lactis]